MHPAAELVEHFKTLKQAGRTEQARTLLETAFTMALMPEAGRPVACKLRPLDQLPRPLASPAHALAQIGEKFILLWFRDDVDLTPAMSLAMFGLYGRLLGSLAPSLAEGETRELIANFSDGCETEGDYRRLSFSCSRPDTLLIPDYLFFNSQGYAELRGAGKPWREREDKLFWRGSASGRPLPPLLDPVRGPWSWHQRLELCHRARQSRFAARIDVALTDHLAILDEEAGKRIEAAGFMGASLPKRTFLDYRYLVDVDGFSNSWGLLEKLLMGATVLKIGSAFGYRQWYYDRLEPWLHYVPVAADLSDLDEVLARLFANPEEAERIAAQGRAFAESLDPEAEMAQAIARVARAFQR